MNSQTKERIVLEEIGVDQRNLEGNQYLTSTVPVDEEAECVDEDSPRNDFSINDTLLSQGSNRRGSQQSTANHSPSKSISIKDANELSLANKRTNRNSIVLAIESKK